MMVSLFCMLELLLFLCLWKVKYVNLMRCHHRSRSTNRKSINDGSTLSVWLLWCSSQCSPRKRDNFVEKRRKSRRRVKKAGEEELSPHLIKEKQPLLLFTSTKPYIVDQNRLVGQTYPPAILLEGSLGDNHYMESPHDMSHTSALFICYALKISEYTCGLSHIRELSFCGVIRRSDVTTVTRNPIYGP